ncbi:MAG: AAA family ATPase [Chloroflexi bacterium]|nr:AAA family ATPase [Chloroflexota bacterium]
MDETGTARPVDAVDESLMSGRIHIVGGPGSGKTTLATRLGHLLRAPVHDLDMIAYATVAGRAAGKRDLWTPARGRGAHRRRAAVGHRGGLLVVVWAAGPARRSDRLAGYPLARGCLSHSSPAPGAYAGRDESASRTGEVGPLRLAHEVLLSRRSAGGPGDHRRKRRWGDHARRHARLAEDLQSEGDAMSN